MREIKFRGKRIDNGEWVYGDVCHHDGVVSYVGQHPADGSMVIYDLRPETVGQFTGLLDKNGKEIYEGDIVECVSWNEYFSKDGATPEALRRKMVVVFHNGAFKMQENLPYQIKPNYWDMIYDGNIVIIGNRFDNPELLEVNKE